MHSLISGPDNQPTSMLQIHPLPKNTMTVPTLSWPLITYADFARGLTFIQYIKECRKTLNRQAPKQQLEARWILEVDHILPHNPLTPADIQNLKGQTNSPAAYYHFRPHLCPTLSRIPNDREIFYLHLLQQRWSDQDSNLQSMRNGHGHFVKTPVFNHLAISAMSYTDMLEWFPRLNGGLPRLRARGRVRVRERWSCERAYHVWAGLVFNLFCMAAEGEKQDVLAQANGPASREYWSDAFEFFSKYSTPILEQPPPTTAMMSLTQAIESIDVAHTSDRPSGLVHESASTMQDSVIKDEVGKLSTAMSQLSTARPPLSTSLLALPTRRKRSGSPLASERHMIGEDSK